MSNDIEETEPEVETFWDKLLRILYGFKKNTTLEKATEYSVELFNRAKGRIWVVEGSLGKDLWANPKVVEALRKAVQRNVEIRIIFGPKLDPENKEIPKLWNEYRDKIHLYELPFRPKTQFAIIDGKDVRVQEPHIPYRNRNAWIKFDTIILARRLELDFKELIAKATEIEIEKAPEIETEKGL